MMTRDDMLRELELLPVWKLRAPVKTPLLEPVIAEPNITAITEALPAVSADLAPAIFEIMLSQDKKWAFIYKPADRTDIGLQGILLNNILQALHIDKPIQSTAQNLSEMNAQLIVAMGESVAQTLINSQDSIENLRGKVHAKADSSIVVTYDLPHLLANPLDKAKAWQDLCLARSHIQRL